MSHFLNSNFIKCLFNGFVFRMLGYARLDVGIHCLPGSLLLVTKEDQYEARKRTLDEYLPISGLQASLRGLAMEDEIDIANFNRRKQQDQKRKSDKA